MAEFLTPRMPEEDGEPGSQVPLPPGRFGDPDERPEPRSESTPSPELYGDPQPPPPPQVEQEPVRVVAPDAGTTRTRPGSLARLISVIVSVGLAWALVVAITAWVLGLFLARG